ncbi:MAG: chitobiase/beta-hexosaminidase C-terminal domain-containing protein, partial [Planctomycetales bacterium]|nr:chitobiase/beta-hexosaminidase C-terminal domain-containing protein [Planctomycetales bacterium]
TSGSAALSDPIVYGYFEEPTPGSPNGAAFVGVVADTKFSVDRGFFSDPISVAISSETPEAMIVYTLDGSTPLVDAQLNVSNGFVYGAPLSISNTTTLRAAAFKQGYLSTNVDSQTYLFLDDVIQQTRESTLADGFPATWGSRSSDYGLDPDVVGPNDRFGGLYVNQIKDSLLAVPSLSITIDNADFFGPSGIYANPTGQGIGWERAASAELIYPDGAQGFQIDAGLRIAGAASRVLSLKNGLRLLFKDEYGDAKLNYAWFGDGVDQFDTIVLRPHFNDGWGWDGALGDPAYVRDQWFRDTQAAMGNPSSRGSLVHLYVNGLYWGLYNPSERPDASYWAEHFGGDKSQYDVMVADSVHDGDGAAYSTMISLAQAVVSAAPADRFAAYQRLQGNLPDGTQDPLQDDYLDVVNYIDYMILNHYGGNNDWPDRNWYAARLRGSESDGFRFVAWDSEIALDLSDRTSLFENNLGKNSGAAQAYGILRNYDEFRLQFADRIHAHLFNEGALYVDPSDPQYDPAHPQSNIPAARLAELADKVSEAIVAESARWGDAKVSRPLTYANWQAEINWLTRVYFNSRHNTFLNQLRGDGLYTTFRAPEFSQPGGTVPQGYELSMLASPGTIYYTLDGETDPRVIGGEVNPSDAVRVYNGAIPLTGDVIVRARLRTDSGQWSGLVEASFSVLPQTQGDYDRN